ncbi:MAG: hypothetical protein ABEJ72_05470 [Candidatus Aenigmatarchaeota archaeon]
MGIQGFLERKKKEAEILEEFKNHTYNVLYLSLILRMAGLFLISKSGIYLANIALTIGWLAGLLAAPVATFYDRRYVSRELGWIPSRIYILLALIPALGLITTAYYLKKRRDIAVKKSE